MKELLQADKLSTFKLIDNNETLCSTEAEKSGWDNFPPEICFFIVDFCKNVLTPIQKIIFYAYYINGMTLQQIADRVYGNSLYKLFVDEEESDIDDSVCFDDPHTSHQVIHLKILDIEKKLKHSWNNHGKWNENKIKRKGRGKAKKKKV